MRAKPYDWLAVTVGSIGLGMRMATEAALAYPERAVICTEGDGSGIYTSSLRHIGTRKLQCCNYLSMESV